MQKFSAVVYTAGRTGSHLIIRNLCDHYHVNQHFDYDTNIVDGIVHTHNPLYTPPSDNFIAIISRRQNLFDAILSMELTKITNEFIDYSDKKITPYAIDLKKFESCYFYQKAFYQIIDTSKFKKVIDIFYEDLISNPDCLLEEFNFKFSISLSKKSPYDYYNLITNIDELKKLYQTLEQTTITDDQLAQFKKTVRQDLDDIRMNYNGNRP